MTEWDEIWEGKAIWEANEETLTWLMEVKAMGDKMQKKVQFLQKSVDVLSQVRGDWITKHNEMIVSVGQLQEANKDLAQLVYDKTEKLEKIGELMADFDHYYYPNTMEAIQKVLGE